MIEIIIRIFMYSFEIISAAFNSNIILCVLLTLPCLFFFILSIFIFYIALHEKNTSGPNSGYAEAVFLFGGFIVGTLSIVLSLLIFNFKFIDLKPEYSKSIAQNIYNKELNNIQKTPNFAYNFLKNNSDLFYLFHTTKKNILSQTDQNTIIYREDISKILQPTYLKCFNEQKENFIYTTYQPIDINTMNHNIYNIKKICIQQATDYLLKNIPFSTIKNN